MMGISDLLAQAEGLGAQFEIQGEKVRVKAPAPLPLSLMEALRQHKAEIMAMLRGPDMPLIPPPPADPLAEAQEIARRVMEHGICLIWADTVQDFLAFVRDDYPREKVPPGFVIYSDSELKELFGPGKHLSPASLRFLHEAKKQGGRIANER